MASDLGLHCLPMTLYEFPGKNRLINKPHLGKASTSRVGKKKITKIVPLCENDRKIRRYTIKLPFTLNSEKG